MSEDQICAAPDCAVPYRGTAETCDYCGGRTMTMRSARASGWVSVVVGILLAGGMAVLAWLLVPLMFDPTGESFNGTRLMAYGILALFALIGMIGVLGIVVGIRRIRTGRVDMHVRKVMLWLAAPLIAFAAIFELVDDFL